MYANLHLHSFYSDGVHTPRTLCEMAKQEGYQALAITDHETVRGVPSLREAAKELGMECLTGIELYADGFGAHFHLTGLDFDPTHPTVQAYLEIAETAAFENTRIRFESYCRREGIRDVTWQDVLEDAKDARWLCNEQVFLTLKRLKGYTEADYYPFFNSFVLTRPDRPGFRLNWTCEQMISMIRDAGGIAVLAHPHRQTKFLPDLVKLGLNGVEVDHPDIDEADVADARAFAAANRLYLSGGTDHTGRLSNYPWERGDDPRRAEGKIAGLPYNTDVHNGVTEEEFRAIKDRIYG